MALTNLQIGLSGDANNFYAKQRNEMQDVSFEFIISNGNYFSFPQFSTSLSALFEISAGDVSNTDKRVIYDRILKADKRSFLKSMSIAKNQLTTWDLDLRVMLPKGGLRWLNIMAKPYLDSNKNTAFYGKISDVTTIKEQEIKVKFSEERFKFALEASTAGVWDWDLKNNKVFYSSQSMKILEQGSADIFDKPELWDKIVHVDDLNKYYADIQEHFDNKTPFYENQHRIFTTSGNYKWILDKGQVIERDKEGKPLRVIGTHTDISEQKEKELELIRTMELYSQQNKRLLNFSHIVSHNLNTQASNIKLLLDEIDNDDTQNSKEMLAHLRTVSNDLNDTITNLTQLVSFKNNSSIPIKSLDLNFYLSKSLAVIKNVKNYDRVTIINEIPVDSFVNFNPAYLESILLNFTTNAIKYSYKNKPIVIKYSFTDVNGVKSLSISDNGLGIDLEKHGDSLFGFFKTFHRNKESRGLGLHITKYQIEAMNGTITVESKVGVGTTFKILFSDALPF